MSLIDKGRGVRFVLDNQRRIIPSASVAMLHDPSGEWWARNSILFAPFSHAGAPVEMDADEREYLGRDYGARLSHVSLPPRSLSSWQPVGRVRTIFYDRTGTRAEGFFKHHFRTPGALQSALAGAALGGFAGLLASATVDSSKPFWVGLVLGAAGGVIVGKAEFPVDPPTTLYTYRNRYWRLELPRLSIANWRGFVLP